MYRIRFLDPPFRYQIHVELNHGIRLIFLLNLIKVVCISKNKEGKMILSPTIKYNITFWVILIYPPEEFGKGNNFIDLFFQE